MHKLNLEKVEEPEIKLPIFAGSLKKTRAFQKNIFFGFIDCIKGFDSVGHNKLWKILKEMEIPDHLTCLLRNVYAGQEATVRTGHETMVWFKIGKRVCCHCMLSHCLFNFYAECIMRNLGWMTHKLNSRLPGKHQQIQICRGYHSNGRKQRAVIVKKQKTNKQKKNLLRVKVESE